MTFSTEPENGTHEKACLIGFDLPANIVNGENVSLKELVALCTTAGIIPDKTVRTTRTAIDPAYYIGKGKAQEVATICASNDIHLVICDHDLSPAQTRNLEKLTNAKVLDRTGIILVIFAQRARSRVGKLQVELAQLQYLLPRLTRLWTHLSRQYAGAGTRGPGETQLEVDRRRAQSRIKRLKNQLEKVHRQRKTQRKRRVDSRVPTVAIVGYTNAGKSTFLHTLTHADVLVEDALFATLDPTTRSYRLPDGEQFLFIDTVGFIRNLPHGLIEAFKATLEETREADILLHIVDASAPDPHAQIDAVNIVLKEIGADKSEHILALNKIDRLSLRVKKELQNTYPNALLISAEYSYGIRDVLDKLKEFVSRRMTHTRLRLPPHKSELLSRLYEEGTVLAAEYEQDAIYVEAIVPKNLTSAVRRYRRKEKE
jgi:GTPase